MLYEAGPSWMSRVGASSSNKSLSSCKRGSFLGRIIRFSSWALALKRKRHGSHLISFPATILEVRASKRELGKTSESSSSVG